MSEPIDQLTNSWGAALFDEESAAVFEYSPVAHKERSVNRHELLSGFAAGNHRVKLLTCGNAVCFPYVLAAEGPVSYCGDPSEPDTSGAGRLFLVEGGRPIPVLGGDSPLADHSDYQRASLVFASSYVERTFRVGELEIRHRLITPLGGAPAIVSAFYVSNHGEGNRWVRLIDAWDIEPHLLSPEFRRPTRRSFASRIGLGQEARRWDNSFLKIKAQGGGQRIQLGFQWDEEEARKNFGPRVPAQIAKVQVISLTKNVASSPRVPLDALLTVLPPGTSDNSKVRLYTEARFQPGRGEAQFGATVYWFGEWEDAKKGLRQLLPMNMIRANEGLLWRKRNQLAVDTRNQEQRDAETWRSGWSTSLAYSAAWTDDQGEYRVPPGGDATFRNGITRDPRLGALLAVVTAYSEPRTAARLLLSEATRVEHSIRDFSLGDDPPPFFLEDALWFLWSLAEYLGPTGAAAESAMAEMIGKTVPAIADLLSGHELYGVNGLLKTCFADRNDLVHQLPGMPSRSSGQVQSVGASAMLVAAVEAVVRQVRHICPTACSELDEVAVASRSALEELASESHYPRWILRKSTVGNRRVFLDHHVWLLLMGLPRAEEERILDLVHRTFLAGTLTPVSELDKPFDEVRVRRLEGSLAQHGKVDLVHNSLLVAALGRRRPHVARELRDRFDPASLASTIDWSWNIPYLMPGSAMPDESSATNHSRPEGDSGEEYWRQVKNDGPIATAFANLGCFGLRAIEGGVALHGELPQDVGLNTRVLSAGGSAGRLSGNWDGASQDINLCVEFKDSQQADLWSLTAGTEAPRISDNGISIKVDKGTRWGLRLKS